LLFHSPRLARILLGLQVVTRDANESARILTELWTKGRWPKSDRVREAEMSGKGEGEVEGEAVAWESGSK